MGENSQWCLLFCFNYILSDSFGLTVLKETRPTILFACKWKVHDADKKLSTLYLNIHIDIWNIFDVLSFHFVLSGIRTRSPPYFTLLSGRWVEKTRVKSWIESGLKQEETGPAILTGCNLHKAKRYVWLVQTLHI